MLYAILNRTFYFFSAVECSVAGLLMQSLPHPLEMSFY